MRSILMPLLVVAVATLITGFAVREMPYFPGDVSTTRMVQVNTGSTAWATEFSKLATAPLKYLVMGLTIGFAFALAGWRGAVIAVCPLIVEQYGAEATKAIFSRPRPSPTMVGVVGSPTGFSFPSTTMTFLGVTFGTLAVLAARVKSASMRWPVFLASLGMILVGGVARVALGAHWPSDVLLTAGLVIAWIWALSRTLL